MDNNEWSSERRGDGKTLLNEGLDLRKQKYARVVCFKSLHFSSIIVD